MSVSEQTAQGLEYQNQPDDRAYGKIEASKLKDAVQTYGGKLRRN
jgi:hypothetical protein